VTPATRAGMARRTKTGESSGTVRGRDRMRAVLDHRKPDVVGAGNGFQQHVHYRRPLQPHHLRARIRVFPGHADRARTQHPD